MYGSFPSFSQSDNTLGVPYWWVYKEILSTLPHLMSTVNYISWKNQAIQSSIILLRHLKMMSLVQPIAILVTTLLVLEPTFASPVTQLVQTGASVGVLMSDYTREVQSLHTTVGILRHTLVSWLRVTFGCMQGDCILRCDV